MHKSHTLLKGTCQLQWVDINAMVTSRNGTIACIDNFQLSIALG